MKNFVILFMLSLFFRMALASNTCIAPANTTAIYFANGINTTNASAQASLNRLMEELGEDYNSQKLEYALAYNQTGGIAIDLIHSRIQLGAQFNSQIMLWLKGIEVVLEKFLT